MFSRRIASMVLSLLVMLAMLAACAPPTPVVVEKEVVVEKPVVETVVVEKQVVVEKPVVETVVVKKEVVITATPAPEKVTIRVSHNNYINISLSDALPPIERIKKEVAKKYPSIEVKAMVLPYEAGPMHDQYTIWFSTEDSTVDVVGFSSYWTAEFGQSGWLLPLDDVISPEILDQMEPEILDAFRYDGKLIALAPYWVAIGGLYYRMDLFEEYGISPPETYDDVLAACDTIREDHPELRCWDWPAMRDVVLMNRWSEYLYGFGGRYFDEEGRCAMNSPEAVAALEFMARLLEEGYSPPEVLSWKESHSVVGFASGKTIFHTGRQDLVFWLDNPEKSKVVGKWGFIPSPAQPGGRHSGLNEAWAFGINRFSEHHEEAVKVLETLAELPCMRGFCLAWGPLQGHVDLWTDPEVLEHNPDLPLIKEISQTALPPLSSADYAEIADITVAEIHSALAGTKAPQKALDDACTRVDEICALE